MEDRKLVIYNLLKDKIIDEFTPLDYKKIERIKAETEKLPLSAKEIMFMIIWRDAFEETGDNKISIPYGGIQKEDGIEFDFNQFPIRLQKILYQFIRMNLDVETRSDTGERIKRVQGNIII